MGVCRQKQPRVEDMETEQEGGMDLARLVEEINRDFGPPFLPKGFVIAKVRQSDSCGEYVNLRIGDRDVDIASDGEFLGAGTNVGSGRKWKIVCVKDDPCEDVDQD